MDLTGTLRLCYESWLLACIFSVLVHVQKQGFTNILTIVLVVGFAFASAVSGRICPWAFSRGLKDKCLERFVNDLLDVALYVMLECTAVGLHEQPLAFLETCIKTLVEDA